MFREPLAGLEPQLAPVEGALEEIAVDREASLTVERLDQLSSPPAPERVRLGRCLFYDVRLSADGTVSCATCHVPDLAFSNRSRFAPGTGGQIGFRKTPSFINAAHAFVPNRFGWDGHASSLEEHSLLQVANPVEIGNTVSQMVRTLRRIAGYAPYFERAFGDRHVHRKPGAVGNDRRRRHAIVGSAPRQ